MIPDAAGLPEAALQPIAREFNYSETVFVLPAADPAHAARLRIFTPTMEVPFAGHPLIGTAVALAELGRGPEMIVETGVGPVLLHAAGDAARFSFGARLDILSRPAAADVAACIGLDPARFAAAPVQAGVGLPFVLVELDGRDSLSACHPVTGAFRAAAERYPADLDFAVYAWARDGDTLHARMFAPLDNIPEDPATGSAAAALSILLGDGERLIRQGEDMGRPSQIETRVSGGTITVAGRAQPVMEGRLRALPAGDSPAPAR